MSPTRIVTVFGATGTQGSSVINALLKHGGFKVRAVTRSVNSESAKALANRGVELVQANLFEKDSVVQAIQGSEVVFAVTNWWDADNQKYLSEHPSKPDPEYTQGQYLVEAAKEAKVKFFIWSSLPHTKRISEAYQKVHPNSKVYCLEHFDHKAEIEELLAKSGLDYAVVHTGWFAENLWKFGASGKTEDGYVIRAPGFKLETPGGEPPRQAITWIEPTLGPVILTLIQNYEQKRSEIHGQTFHAVTTLAPYEELARLLEKSTGKKWTFSGEGSSGMKEADEMYEYQARIGMYRDAEIPDPRLIALGVKFPTLEEFAANEETKSHF